MSAFLCKKLLKAIVWELCQRFFSSVFRFCKRKGYYYWKHIFCRLFVRNLASGLLQIGQKSKKWQWRHNFLTWRHRQLFFGPCFMSLSSLVLELRRFSFIRDWPEIQESEIPPSTFCPISWDWDQLWIPHLAQMSPIECYWMLQISRVTAFTVFELLRKNELEEGGWGINPPPRLGLNICPRQRGTFNLLQ